ncbi:serine hydrolase domain-containing protein [Ruminiclostridium josui]|uniref:serine hydrolase domain-containing protein n=1 Tax=Ruminiclostridium josui TaxID=1499 RepID=UPI000A4A269B|nr:serine hydrolase domain-containing protein [Ruminiclostridium josui]
MDKSILADYLDSLEAKGIPGCDCVIFHNHKQVFRHTTGFSDAKKTKPLTSANTYWLFSATKLITCTAVIQLIEKGKISLDAPVADYLPEYKHLNVKCGSEVVPAKNTLTIRHLLSMQSGLNYNLQAPSILKVLKDTNNEATTREIIRELAKEPLEFEPGTHFLYSLSHDVLGAVIEEAAGQKFGEYLDEHILKPIGMKNTGFELTADREANMSEQFEFDMDTMTSKPISLENCYKLSNKYESGGAGLISTADDYILFLDAMCNDGVSANGYRVLTRESIDLMRKDQMNDISKKDFDEFGRIGYSYGLGVRTLIEKEKSGSKSPVGNLAGMVLQEPMQSLTLITILRFFMYSMCVTAVMLTQIFILKSETLLTKC